MQLRSIWNSLRGAGSRKTGSESILDYKMHISLDLNLPVIYNSRYLTDRNNLGHFASQLLTYDQIIIPTIDFGVIPILVNWIGTDLLVECLRQNTLLFAHRPSLLGYLGNGLGINAFVIKPGEEKPFLWWQTTMFGEIEESITLQLHHWFPSLSNKIRSKLISSVIENSATVENENDDFLKYVEEETYRDILSSVDIKTSISVMSGSPPKLDLKRLPGVEPNMVQVADFNEIKRPTDLVLRIAEINQMILMTRQFNNCDMFVPAGSENLLRLKLKRTGADGQFLNGLNDLFDLENIPDIESVVSSGQIPFDKIWKIRNRKESNKFRGWLRKADTKDARDLERLYVTSLGKKSFYQSFPIKVLRFAITKPIDAVHPGLGTGLDIADNFFIERWLSGYTPKLFFDNLANLFPKAKR